MKELTVYAVLITAQLLNITAVLADNKHTQLYWGDTHLHSNLSTDAYLNNNTTATPDDAYRFAKGAPVIDANSRAKVQIDTPLDFVALTDHAEYLGLAKMIWEGDPRVANTKTGKRYAKMIQQDKGTDIFFEIVKAVNANKPNQDFNGTEIRRDLWQEIIDAAERHNNPGKFTTLIGWEWSAIPKGQNLHRIVFMPQGREVAEQFIPVNAFDTDIETQFWQWLDKTSKATGADFVAIPHNANISNGLMFAFNDRYGNPITRGYANTRMRWEPVIETTQFKGDSETHPLLSPTDEFADFETYEHLIKTDSSDAGDPNEARKGSYVREGLKRGLAIGQNLGVNPFKYGIIGASDSHTGYSSVEENNFWGKFSYDSIPDNKTNKQVAPGAYGWDMSASGLAGVWATENTRHAITAAFKRRETYATSGPRIVLRFFGGYHFERRDTKARDIARVGYKNGVSMGGDLTVAPKGKAPRFLVHAVKDPKDANLDRIQMVKGWLDRNGKTHEKVYNVAWSGKRQLDQQGVLPALGSTVDLTTGLYTNTTGAPELLTVWKDPDFNSNQPAFYYVRVLQIPTPRNSTYDAIALGIEPTKTGHAVTIQERAYSSPIWYTP